MREKYEVDNDITQEKAEYVEEKFLKKLKLVRNEFKVIGKYGMPLIKSKLIGDYSERISKKFILTDYDQ